jgi:hypothetical protein
MHCCQNQEKSNSPCTVSCPLVYNWARREEMLRHNGGRGDFGTRMRLSTSIVRAAFLFPGAIAASQGQESTTSSHLSQPLKIYLRGYLNVGVRIPPDTTTRVTPVRVSTDEGKSEDVVYVSGQRWCGRGGCTLLILEPAESTFKVLGSSATDDGDFHFGLRPLLQINISKQLQEDQQCNF